MEFFTNHFFMVIDAYIFELELLALFLIFIVVIKKNEINSSIVAIVVSLLVGLYSLVIGPKVLDWAANTPDLKHEIRFVFYMGFIHADLAGIYVIRKINEVLKVKPGDICNLVLLMFVARASITTIRYMERLIQDTNYLELFYKTSINSINVTSTLTILCLSFMFLMKNTAPIKANKIVNNINNYIRKRTFFFPVSFLINKKWKL